MVAYNLHYRFRIAGSIIIEPNGEAQTPSEPLRRIDSGHDLDSAGLKVAPNVVRDGDDSKNSALQAPKQVAGPAAELLHFSNARIANEAI